MRNMSVVECQTHDLSKEAADRKLMLQAFKYMEARDFKKLTKLKPKLQTALTRAPDKPSQPEKCGDEIIIYAEGLVPLLMMSAMLKDGQLGASKVTQREPLPYAMLAYAAGWMAFEDGDFATAEASYSKGLLNEPDNLALTAELSTALAKQGRTEEALAVADAYLSAHDDPEDTNRALMLRRRGYALIDLNRLDEAEAAYKEALALVPDHQIALNQLAYIREQKAAGSHDTPPQ
ncbi:tetratricopeptide repeat protein [Asticcacaulis sp. ZE23SCel15]|uniref:tetratricopeptide repeat protein n=1 Tax=Asticcacaulis sp. ZE23SCel15 TaxID=3059027 RepID=UPI00265DB8C6|nr:tetratricopeptide repeat protein [Asticcacaulis sp. ZE23SCel15]WKL58228.1 tetratricopeptide repeat protein [Asticcacaulis sp. ZE23SCel15]